MYGHPPISTLTDQLFPNTTHFRSWQHGGQVGGRGLAVQRIDADEGHAVSGRRQPVPDRPALRTAPPPDPAHGGALAARCRSPPRGGGGPADRGGAQGREDEHRPPRPQGRGALDADRSEEHTSELQSLMRISYAVFCLKKKKIKYLK